MPNRIALKTAHQIGLIAVPPPFLALATLTLGLRFWACKQKKRQRGLPDWLCLAALVVTYGEYVSLVVATVWGGLGLYYMDVPFENLNLVFKALLSVSECWGTAVSLIQLSILTFYIQTFFIVKWFKYACSILIVIVLIWWVSYFTTLLTACIPLKAFWTPGLHGKCIDMWKFAVASTISHIIIDVLLVVLVLPIIWNLKTSMSNKVTVSISLAIGIVATTCAITRFGLRVKEWTSPDATGTGYVGALLDVLENSLAVTCSSLPSMTFLVARLGDRVGSSKLASSIRRLMSDGSSDRSSDRQRFDGQKGSDSDLPNY